MGHETGHVVQRHMAREYAAMGHMSLVSTAAMLAAVVLAAVSGAGGEAIEGAIAMTQAVALQQGINFVRSQKSRPTT